MDETKVQIGEDVLLDIGIHSEWYISSIGYDGESVDVALRRKADRNKEAFADRFGDRVPEIKKAPAGFTRSHRSRIKCYQHFTQFLPTPKTTTKSEGHCIL